VLRPPASDLRSIPQAIIWLMSRKAVSGEHFAIFAHLLAVSFPSKPSSS